MSHYLALDPKLKMPAIPDRPTKGDAERVLGGLSHLMQSFPFACHRLAATIATGRSCPVIAAGRTEEETEKCLGALLFAGVSIVSLDNVSADLGGELL